MPLGRIAGPPVTPLSLTIPARKSATICFSAAFSASRRSVRASRSPRDSSERGIFSGTDMLGTNRVRYEQGQPRSSSYLPGFLPQVPGRPEEFHLQPPTEPPLDLHGSPFPCPLAMTVDAESDCSARSLGWRPPSLSIRFAPRSLQVLRRYYRMIRPRHAHRYFPPSCFALVRFSRVCTFAHLMAAFRLSSCCGSRPSPR